MITRDGGCGVGWAEAHYGLRFRRAGEGHTSTDFDEYGFAGLQGHAEPIRTVRNSQVYSGSLL